MDPLFLGAEGLGHDEEEYWGGGSRGGEKLSPLRPASSGHERTRRNKAVSPLQADDHLSPHLSDSSARALFTVSRYLLLAAAGKQDRGRERMGAPRAQDGGQQETP